MITLYQAALLFDDIRGTTKLGVGIHEGVDVTSIDKGDNYYDINYAKDGLVINKRLWEPTGNYPQKRKDGTTETQAEAISREEKLNIQHLLVLTNIFLGKEFITKLPDLEYTPMMDKLVTALRPKLATKKVNLKVLYDADGVYPTLSRNADNQVEEHIPGEEPKIHFTEWEKKERITPKAKTVPKDAALDSLYN